jgi:predicted site-specific integrase-resolvase
MTAMSPFSTSQVAAQVGIDRVTLERWLREGKVKPPKMIVVGDRRYRLWNERYVAAVRRYKEKFYRKGRGRKTKRI